MTPTNVMTTATVKNPRFRNPSEPSFENQPTMTSFHAKPAATPNAVTIRSTNRMETFVANVRVFLISSATMLLKFVKIDISYVYPLGEYFFYHGPIRAGPTERVRPSGSDRAGPSSLSKTFFRTDYIPLYHALMTDAKPETKPETKPTKPETSTRMYVVAHKKTYPENADDTDDRFRWYVVNENIHPKDIHVSAEKRIDEWTLAWYEPDMQANNFREISALVHAKKNPELSEFEYIGFAQYDMKVSSDALDAFEAAPGENKLGVGVWYPESKRHVYDMGGSLPREFWEAMVETAFPGTTWADLGHVPLCTTFIASKKTFDALMAFLDPMIMRVIWALDQRTTHLAGNLERVVGVWLAGAIASGFVDTVVDLSVIHDHSYRV